MKEVDIGRRNAMKKLGLTTMALYVAPVLTELGQALADEDKDESGNRKTKKSKKTRKSEKTRKTEKSRKSEKTKKSKKSKKTKKTKKSKKEK